MASTSNTFDFLSTFFHGVPPQATVVGMDRLASAAEVDKLLGETSGPQWPQGREYPGWKTCRSCQFPLVQEFKIHFHKMD